MASPLTTTLTTIPDTHAIRQAEPVRRTSCIAAAVHWLTNRHSPGHLSVATTSIPSATSATAVATAR